ncbi:MAG: prepilin-type N-terminal cleavage/methylation domain-containing protein, partial [Bdellovibrionaceae bacterium]|nr:prepilin-type N-terminal cleavage/methylation domain-containing protein [Pseudobdellovibrionaceae bacterium]
MKNFIYNFYMVIFNNKAFSLIELLVTVGIISILVTFGAKFYNENIEKNYITTAKAELVNVLQYANFANTTDKGYHQFLYQVGYTPKGILTSIVGTGASRSAPCCNAYPALGTSPCQKGQGLTISYPINQNESCSMGFICNSGCNLGICNIASCNCEMSHSPRP